MNCIKFLLPAAVTAALFTGCEKSENPPENTGYSNGIYVVNEGTYTQNNGSISFVDIEQNTITNGIFEAANNRSLGDVVQSLSVVNDSIGYIVVNNSAKVEIVQLKSFRTKSDPIQVNYPRYFLQVSSDQGYLTAGSFQGYVYTIDLNTATKTDSIAVGFGPETMLLINDRVYVANSGGWASDSTLSVIDIDLDEEIDKIQVGIGPVDLTTDSEENIWVYCKGYTNYNDIETDALLQKVDPVTKSILWEAKVGKALDYSSTPAKCASSGDGSTIYYLRPDGIYEINAVNPQLSLDPLIAGNFYGLDADPHDGKIYLFETSFSGNGLLKIYDADGNLLSEGMVGVGPSGAVFNY